MENILIRKANIKDINSIIFLSHNLLKYEQDVLGHKLCNVNYSYSNSSKNMYLNLIKNGVVYIAQDSDICIGYICGDIFKNLGAYTVSMAEIYNLYVLDKYRGMGIAKRLMDVFKEHCKNFKVEYVKLKVLESNKNANDFYKSQGYLNYTKDLMVKI